jgi:hypothetical protein
MFSTLDFKQHDHVFCSKELELTGALDLPMRADLNMRAENPFSSYPSNHYALGYVFDFELIP